VIVGLRGTIIRLEPMYAEIDVGGVIYGMQMSLNATSMLQTKIDSQPDAPVKIICAQIIREDAHLLFGFCEEIEKQTFERLIKISGVGPKVAIAILSTYTPTHFAKIIADKDIEALKKVPGIGVKGAAKIMVDIAGFFAQLLQSQEESIAPSNNLKYEASLALQSLGFKRNEIQKVLEYIEALSVSEIVKEALKRLA